MTDRDVCIGQYLVIAERNGTGTVYDDGGSGEEVHHADTFKAAKAWVYAELGQDDPEPEAKASTRPIQKKPCRQCPFRRVAAAGWLGASPPEGFIATIMADVESLPCHSTVNYERPDWHERWTNGTDPKHKMCAGAVTLARNTGRMPRCAPKDREPDTKVVFGSFKEFIEHHRRSKVISWTDPPNDSPERAALNMTRTFVQLPVLK